MHETQSPHYWLSLAHAALQRGDETAAADAFNRYLSRAPHDTATHYTLATLYLKLGRPDYAVQLMDGLVRQQPQNPDAACYRGAVLAQAGRTPEALADYQRALQLNPVHPGALQALQGLGVAAAGPYRPAVPTASWAPPRSELLTTTETDSQDLMSLLSWGGVVVLGIAALVALISGIGMVSANQSPNLGVGWAVLALGLLLGGGDVAAVIYLLRREIGSP